MQRLARASAAALLVLFIVGCAGGGTKSEDLAEVRNSSAANEMKGFTLKEDAVINSDMEADFREAIEALESGESDRGIALLEKITLGGPKATAPYINLAIAYTKVNKLDRAERSLKTALLVNPHHPVANNEYGMILRKTGRFAEAKAVYEQVLARYPEFLPARKNLGVLCDLYLRDLECALKHYRAYSAAAPDDKPVTIWIADIERRLGRE